MTTHMPLPVDVRLMNMASVLMLCGVLMLLLAAGVWWVLRYPGFALHRVVVEGDMLHNDRQTLRAEAVSKITGTFFTVDLGRTRAVFENVPWVRAAQVSREFPGTLHVRLLEYTPVAMWGDDAAMTLVDDSARVFEVDRLDLDEDLPRLRGPAGTSAEVLQMYRSLQPVFAAVSLQPVELSMNGRGNWRVVLDNGAVVELGGGEPQELLQRAQRLAGTLPQVAAHYQRQPQDMESADLRHAGGYALKLRGVTTTVETPAVQGAGRRNPQATGRSRQGNPGTGR